MRTIGRAIPFFRRKFVTIVTYVAFFRVDRFRYPRDGIPLRIRSDRNAILLLQLEVKSREILTHIFLFAFLAKRHAAFLNTAPADEDELHLRL
jgi:hypothetical protein